MIESAKCWRTLLLAGAVAVAAAWLAVTWIAFTSEANVMPATAAPATVPAHDYAPWQSVPIQDGRIKPLQTASVEAIRQITGRTRFDGLDPVAVVLAWMLSGGHGAGHGFTDWEVHPFLLCDHHDLRRAIFATDGSDESAIAAVAGKFVTPRDLRHSLPFDQLLEEAARLRKLYESKAHLHMTTVQLKAEELARRLTLYDSLCGRSLTRLARNAVAANQFVDVRRLAEAHDLTPAVALARRESSLMPSGPLRMIVLDRVPGSSWFSITELEALQREPGRWATLMKQRLAQRPTAYVGGEAADAVRAFHEQLQRGHGHQAIDDLERTIRERQRQRPGKAPFAYRGLVTRLRQGVDRVRSRNYDPDDPELRILHLEFLEGLYPDMYRESVGAQPFPAKEVQRALDSFRKLCRAYAGDSEAFALASREFIDLLSDVGRQIPPGSYPGSDSIDLEMLYNKAQPFFWAWLLMLPAMLLLGTFVATGWRWSYCGGLLLYLLAVGLQGWGGYLRVCLSGRAPVSNMYETVVFAAFMAAIFAFILELIYRRGIFVLAGAAVATLGLILADQLPLALDPSISPIVPVLRSNYWLTVHVLTIVSSYAAGTLAWALGNLTLAITVLGKSRPDTSSTDTLKTLAHFTYRAMQIAVLLLAMGTFLGGWWAAHAWGRFWGWDPKEVGALLALVCYVIPLHARYIGWIGPFGLAVAAVLCYASIILSWYVINFVFATGLHSYGFASGGAIWVLWAVLLNLEWVLLASWAFLGRNSAANPSGAISLPGPPE